MDERKSPLPAQASPVPSQLPPIESKRSTFKKDKIYPKKRGIRYEWDLEAKIPRKKAEKELEIGDGVENLLGEKFAPVVSDSNNLIASIRMCDWQSDLLIQMSPFYLIHTLLPN